MPRRYGVFLLNSFVVYRFQLDVTDENAVTNAAKCIEEKDGKLDILVNKYGLYLNLKIRPVLTSLNEQCWN